jgi:hypothetical protein
MSKFGTFGDYPKEAMNFIRSLVVAAVIGYTTTSSAHPR